MTRIWKPVIWIAVDGLCAFLVGNRLPLSERGTVAPPPVVRGSLTAGEERTVDLPGADRRPLSAYTTGRLGALFGSPAPPPPAQRPAPPAAKPEPPADPPVDPLADYAYTGLVS